MIESAAHSTHHTGIRVMRERKTDQIDIVSSENSSHEDEKKNEPTKYANLPCEWFRSVMQ